MRVADAKALITVPAALPFPDLEARRLIDLSDIALRFRDRQGSQQLLDRARSLSRDNALVLRAANLQGQLLRAAGRCDEALEGLTRNIALAREKNEPYHEAFAQLNASICEQDLSHYDEELKYTQAAIDAASKIGARRQIGWAHTNMGIALHRLGETARAREHEQKAAEVFAAIGDRVGQISAQGEIGNTFFLEGNVDEGIKAYERAYDLARQFGFDDGQVLWSSNLANAHVDASHWDEAGRWNRIAEEIATRGKYETRLLRVAANNAAIAEGHGDTEAAIRLYTELLPRVGSDTNLAWSTHSSLGQAYARTRRYARANREFETALQIIEKARSLPATELRMSLMARLIRFYQQYVDVLVEQGNENRALQVAESSRARVLAERLGRPSDESTIDPRRLQALARKVSATLLSYWIAPARSYLWIIRPDSVRRVPIQPGADIERLVSAYQRQVEGDPLAPKDDSGTRLWTALLAEAVSAIPPAGRVVVVPDGPLHRLNLETLRSPQGRYWLEDAEISIAPSLGVLEREAPRGSRSMLLIGAPVQASSEYPFLAHASDELDGISAIFHGASTLRGSSATPDAYRAARPASFDFIHFAAHAEANRESPLDSAVILSPKQDRYKLYARDVIDIPIDAELVTISSCKSAGVRAYAGEGLIGFAWAFLGAGARSVIAGLWDVSDSRTESLMKELYAGIARGLPPAGALRQAKLAMLRGGNSSPYYWAPFQIYVKAL